MDKLTKNISDIIINEIELINVKIRGLYFLELLKSNLIEKLLLLIQIEKQSFNEMSYYEKKINNNLRDIKISLNYFVNSSSISKKNIENDTLFLVFNESSNFDIYEDDQNFKSILLYKNTGISLPKSTTINSKFTKNTILIEIINKDVEQILTK